MRASRSAGRLLAVVSAALLWAGGATASSDVFPGFDLWITPPGGAVEDFGGAIPAIPADFFFFGSDPFVGQVDFTGVPIPVFLGQPTGGADTIVERQATAAVLPVPSSDTIPVELVALSLQSVDPITVTTAGGMPISDWDVSIDLSGVNPSTGTMTIFRTQAEGGTWDSSVDLCPLLTFTELVSPFRVRVLDWCSVFPPQGFSSMDCEWNQDPAGPLNSPLSGPNFFDISGGDCHTGPHPDFQPVDIGAPLPPIGGPLPVPVLSVLGALATLVGFMGLGTLAGRRAARRD